jgi:putative ABC transport system permease protein
LGATHQQLRSAQRIEMILIGILAGLMSAAGAVLVAWGLVHWVFEFEMQWSVWPWLLGVGICVPASLLTGKLVLNSVLHTPPWVVLRQN